MKRIIALILSALCLLSLCACGIGGSENKAQAWLEEQMDNNTLFSFDYDGVPFADFISSWDKYVECTYGDNEDTLYTLTYEKDGVTAKCDIILYKDYPAIDWVINFENTASADSKPISNIQALNTDYAMENPTVQYAYGGNSDGHDFEPLYFDFTESDTLSFESVGGRSSNGYMPYYDMYNDAGGIVVAIGWTGQWTATFNKTENGVNLIAGMTETDIALHANESMRTPSIVMTFFEGNREDGQNIFRSLVLNNYYPVDETGETLTELPLSLGCWGSDGEERLFHNIESANVNGWEFDTLWVDAGWHGENASADTYDTAWYYEAGNWYINEDIYPNGLSPVTEKLHEQGKKFILWFEPERVVEGSDIDVNHPEYVLKGSATTMFQLYNLADDEATDYLIELIGGIIKDNGIDWYRQDFNCDPKNIWSYNDRQQGEHRTGITEIKYITNLYRYLDGIIEMNPGLIMDNCASGGRRLDIEMSKRSVPLWRSDYYVSGEDVQTNSECARNIAWNLSYWVPMSGGGYTSDGLNTAYDFRCQMGSGMQLGVQNTSNKDYWADRLEEYFNCRELMNGNYYILGQGTGDEFNTTNAAYEYFVPEKGAGFIMAFRPEESSADNTTYRLWGLDRDVTYTLTVADNDEVFEAAGAELMDKGLNINLQTPRSSVIIYINAK